MPEQTQIRLARCMLRGWRREDESRLAHHANNRKIWRNLRDLFPHPYTLEDARDWIVRTQDVFPARNFVVEFADDLAGSIGLVPQADVHRRTAEIGYWIAEPYWGLGLATEAVCAVSEYGFATFDLVRIEAGVFASNPASMRVLEKAGFAREGWLRKSVTKDGVLLDSALYARLAESGADG